LQSDGDHDLAGLRPEQIVGAALVAEEMLGEALDSEGLATAFEELPSGVKRKFYETMAASPHLRILDLLDAVEGKLTLDEQYATEYGLKGLPRAYKRVLMG
jgi:hypothetical protein